MSHRNLKDLHLFAWLFCLAVSIIEINLFVIGDRRVDFGYFYSLGHILNHYPAQRIYDMKLQASVFKHVLPGQLSALVYGPSPYPPFLALFFRPFALLPFWSALACWSVISLSLYLAGILLLVRRFCPADPIRQSLFCCIGLSLWTFLGRTLLNGQLSTLAFFAIALAVIFDTAGRHYMAGIALAVCSYKPTFLILLVPMLLITWRSKILAGFLAGVAFIMTLTTYLEGSSVWFAYVYATFHFPRDKVYLVADHVDLLTFSDAVSHGWPLARWTIMALGFTALCTVARIWWLSARSTYHLPAGLIWGTTITWTLLLNVYTPLYDTVLVIVSLIATRTFINRFSPKAFTGICLLIVFSSYGARELSAATGIQDVTLVLAALGSLQLALCLKALKGDAVAISDSDSRLPLKAISVSALPCIAES
jgi:hypothetical protein